jgi:hypothetical protein
MFASVNFYVCSEQSFTRESLSNEDIKYPHAFGLMFAKNVTFSTFKLNGIIFGRFHNMTVSTWAGETLQSVCNSAKLKWLR